MAEEYRDSRGTSGAVDTVRPADSDVVEPRAMRADAARNHENACKKRKENFFH